MHKQHPQTAYRKDAVLIGTIFENCDKKRRLLRSICAAASFWLGDLSFRYAGASADAPAHHDIREAHKKDSESAPQTTVADELKENLEAVENFKGSRDEKLVVLTVSSLVSTIKICQMKNFAG